MLVPPAAAAMVDIPTVLMFEVMMNV